MQKEIAGRRVVICGATGGIGAAAVRGFVERGALVAGIYNRSEPADDLRSIAAWFKGDLSVKDEADQCIEAAAAHLGGIDAMIQTAGTWRGAKPESAEEEQIDFLIAANLKSTIFANQAAFRHMKETGGRIINFGSVEGVDGAAESPVYAASRGAVQAWTRSAAKAWGRYGINVNAIAPIMWTPLFESSVAGLTSEQRASMDRQMQSSIPIDGKPGDPTRDCVPLLAFLSSEGSRYITGQLISVDGGLRMLGA